MKAIKGTIALFLLTLSSQVYAQGDGSKSFFEQYQIELVLGLAVLVCLVAILAMFVMLVGMKAIIKLNRAEQGIEDTSELIPAREGEEGLSFWGRFWNRFNDAVPVAKEATVTTDHEYDGIRELDNRLPPWWLYGFYISIIFAVIYLVHYHVIGTGESQEEEYQSAMIQAESDVKAYLASLDNLVDESNVELLTSGGDLSAGEGIYQASCAVCHAKDGGGGVGPNFTDQYWIHGGDIKSIFYTVKYGVPAKGMISWESQLSPKQMQQVSSFIYTLEGNTSADPKDPQGELFERETPGTEEAIDDEADLAEDECC